MAKINPIRLRDLNNICGCVLYIQDANDHDVCTSDYDYEVVMNQIVDWVKVENGRLVACLSVTCEELYLMSQED